MEPQRLCKLNNLTPYLVTQEWARNVRAGKTSKGDKLGPVDHAAMNYRPFRRNFYIEVPELTRMSAEELVEYRKQLDGIKVCCAPWAQGLKPYTLLPACPCAHGRSRQECKH